MTYEKEYANQQDERKDKRCAEESLCVFLMTDEVTRIMKKHKYKHRFLCRIKKRLRELEERAVVFPEGDGHQYLPDRAGIPPFLIRKGN